MIANDEQLHQSIQQFERMYRALAELRIGALVEPYRYSLSARCAGDSTLLIINQADIQNLIRTDSDLGCTIMTNLAQKLLDRLKETRQESKIHINTLIKSAAL